MYERIQVFIPFTCKGIRNYIQKRSRTVAEMANHLAPCQPQGKICLKLSSNEMLLCGCTASFKSCGVCL